MHRRAFLIFMRRSIISSAITHNGCSPRLLARKGEIAVAGFMERLHDFKRTPRQRHDRRYEVKPLQLTAPIRRKIEANVVRYAPRWPLPLPNR